ncbi:unnamed protein product [Echinostoma caproni]|uniref:Phorbol-ester/DAG-type domain-containing protein n=1 Tax=Echinostoma caproni TaxID=27848 RepID=A0A183BF43_9TREM|nr:unnamed protein product [Echinostoma caproni]
MEMKRSTFTLSNHHSVVARHIVPSTVTEESSSVCSSDAVTFAESNYVIHNTPSNRQLTPKAATLNRLNRPHDFIPRSVLRMDVCSACGRRIAFGKTAYKCATCGLLVHESCQKKLAQTCVPPSASRTPLSAVNHTHAWATSPRRCPSSVIASQQAIVPALPFGSSRSRGPIVAPTSPTLSVRLRNINLAEFCPEDQFPRIPALIIHCVTEVVARGMNTVGLYRVSGSEKQVRGFYSLIAIASRGRSNVDLLAEWLNLNDLSRSSWWYVPNARLAIDDVEVVCMRFVFS